VLGAVVGTFLLMACVNLAGVLLARGFTRRREMAVRLSLGARRPDLVRALLAETLLVAGLGGAAGLLVARGGLGLLEAWMPPTSFPLHLGARLDGPVLGFALLLTLLTALAAGLLPAFRATRRDVTAALRDESGSVAAGRDSTRLRQRLVVGQLALSVVLLVAAGLLARSLGQIRTYDVGFDPRGVLIASLELFTSGYDAERGRAFYRTLLERLAALPGVDAVSTARRAPLGFGGSSSSSVEVEGWEPPKDGFAWGYYNNVGPGYFSTLRMPLARGRGFTLADDEKAARVAVVNEAMARRYWGGREAVGGRFRLGPDWISVVGVVRNATLRDVGERPAPWFFLPVLQSYRPDMTVFLRTRGDPAALTRPLAQAVASLDPNLALFGTYTLEAHLGASDFRQRAGSRILGLFGVLGLALASLGLYGILAFFVAHRQREIGIRLALGSSRAEVFRLVLRQGLRLTAAGVGTGLLLGGAVARLLRALLVGVGPADPVTFAGVLLLLCVVAALACLVPARRAASVDPAATLRFE
jgi:predicted permease